MTRFGSWRKAGGIDEETLIKILKDKKRAYFYRIISDKRNAFLKEAYEGSRPFEDLTKEFAAFSYEKTHEWFDVEEKLSAIILEFKAKSKSKKPIDINAFKKNTDLISIEVGRGIDNTINRFNVSMDDYLGGFFNKDVNGISRVGTEELKSFLKVKVEQFKKENEGIGEQQKMFINNSIKKLIQSKLEKIRSGELDEDSLNRSDLFTDEEVNALTKEQEAVVLNATSKRRASNVNAINEVAQKFIGVSGKQNILQKLNECPDHIISDEVKKVVADAIDNGCIFESSESGKKTRVPRIVAKTVGFMLDQAAFGLERLDNENATRDLYNDKIYNFCNRSTGYLAHVFTFGFCTGYTVAAQIDKKIIDFKAIANILSAISFLVGIFNAENWCKLIVGVLKNGAELLVEKGCETLENKNPEMKEIDLSTRCSEILFFYKAFNVVRKEEDIICSFFST